MALANWTTAASLDKPSSPLADDAIASATQILFLLSGRKFSGPQTVTEEYNIISGASYLHSISGATLGSGGLTDSYIDTYTDIYGGGGSATARPGGSVGSGVYLRGRPVQNVSAVSLGTAGTAAEVGSWEVLDKSYLRPKASAKWRMYGIVTVTYTYGVEPPVAGYRAATVLANELIASQDDCDSCRLPDRVTSLTREGINMTILDPQNFLDKGKTGIYEIDLFLSAYNPRYAKARPRVFGPFVPRGKRITS